MVGIVILLLLVIVVLIVVSASYIKGIDKIMDSINKELDATSEKVLILSNDLNDVKDLVYSLKRNAVKSRKAKKEETKE